MWLVMLNKRLYKKPSFVVILALVLVLSALITLSSQEDSGILNIALYAQGGGTSSAIIDELAGEKSIISYTVFDTEEEALAAVEKRDADALWLFPEDTEKAVNDFVRKRKPIVRVIEYSDNVFLRLSREKLYSKLYTYVSKAVYTDYMNGILDGVKDADIIESSYDGSIVTDSIIDIKFNNSEDKAEDLDYIAGPMRGMLSVMILISALAALMYFKQDKEKGLFAGTPLSMHAVIEFVYVFIAAANTAVVTLFALGICGLFTSAALELVFMLMYVLMCAVFCTVLGAVTDRIAVIGAMLPSLTLMTLALCPVFLNIKRVKYIQTILPTYHYLTCFSNPAAFLHSMIYIAAGAVICLIIRRVKNRRFI